MSPPRIPVSRPEIGERERRYMMEAVDSGWVSSLGDFIGRFESGFARYCDVPHGVAVSNGTTALEVALKALGVGRGDEVVVPAMTFAAAAAVVVHVGAEPVLVDVHPDYWCLDPEALRRAVGSRTRAVIAVHSYGHPCDLEPILAVCGEGEIPVLEDCAEAHGARYRGRRVGGLGRCGTFSFYGNKIITTGEGGMVVTEDGSLAERIRQLKDHAMDPGRRYFHFDAGYNFRLTNPQAALGCAQLERIEEFLDKRARLLAWYRTELGDVAGVRLNPSMDWAEPVNWIVCLELSDATLGERRDEIATELARYGVDTRPFFVPLGEMPPYRGARRVGRDGERTPVAERLSRSGLNLPTSTTMDRDTVAYIGRVLRELLAGRR
jgi:perosamine synthetase